MNAFLFEEKRKKNYLYNILHYTLSSLSYFDFASPNLLQNFQELQILERNLKSCSFLDVLMFSSFFIQKNKYLFNTSIKKFLRKTTNKLQEFKTKISFFEKIAFKKNLKFYNQVLLEELLKYYEISVENAFLKYKNPIITKENFLLTSINEKPQKFQNVLNFFFKNKKQWYIFQYKLIRYIYFKNLFLQKFIKKNLWYYYYLLKKFNQKNFLKKKLIKKVNFQNVKKLIKNFQNILLNILLKKKKSKKILFTTKGLLSFRSLIINFLLILNFQKILEDEIFLNINQKVRKYYLVKQY